MEIIELANAVIKALASYSKKVAVAESCTGGGVCKALTEISGSSKVFECGIISYADCVKADILGVDPIVLEQFGAVSRQVACSMAKGVLEKGKADFGLSTTGFAGPTGGDEDFPVGTVFIAVATRHGVHCKKLSLLEECTNDRHKIRETAVKYLLEFTLDVIDKES